MAKISLNNIAHSYGANPVSEDDYALKKLNHVWEDGGAYALLGPSGCGKTTLLNIISGLLKPSEGQVLFGDDDVTARETAHRNIAQVFQFPVIYDTMSVRENLAFPLRNRGLKAQEIDARVKEVSEMLGIADKLDQRAAQLSADLKQVISLGRGLVRSDVNAILFDEPLTVIDPHMKWVLRTKLRELHTQFGFTMVYVTHDQTEALTFADKVVVMKDGKVLQMGTPEELFERPEHTFVGHFIGSPGMNVLPASVNGNKAEFAHASITLPHDYGALGAENIEIGIRPEFLKVVPQRSGNLDVDITAIEDLGRHKIARCIVSGKALAVLVPEEMDVRLGFAALTFDPTHTLVYQNGYLMEGGTNAP